MPDDRLLAALAADMPARRKSSNYPAPFAERVAGRTKQALGDRFGIRSFGVNRTTLAPGAQTALLHRHEVQDELVYVLEGAPLLRTDAGEVRLAPGMVAGFPANGPAHHIVNDTDTPVALLEIGDRQPGDGAVYPEDDLVATQLPDRTWAFHRKDGTPY